MVVENTRISDGENVDAAFIEQGMEHVDSLDRFAALLLVAEYQVDPLVQMGAHVLALESLIRFERTRI